MKTTFTLIFIAFICSTASAQGLPLPYYTGFDSSAEQAGWQQFHTGDTGSSDWGVGGGGFSLPTCVSHDYNVGGGSNDTVVDWYVSPALHFTGPALLALKVRTGGFSFPFEDNCEVWYSIGESDPASGNYQLLMNLSYIAPQGTWHDTSAITSFVGENVYIALKYKTIGAAWMTYGIDNINITTVSSVNENAIPTADANVLIYPNPVNTNLHVSLPSDFQNVSVLIYDQLGNLVKSIHNLSALNADISTADIPSGVYNIRIQTDNKTSIERRIVVQK